jgi:hypothetical protein
VDHITADGTELTQLPYPFHVAEDGSVLRQDFWRGDPLRILGFTARPEPGDIVLWWADAVKDPQQAVGLYMVSQDSKGNMASHVIAVSAVTVTEGAEDAGDVS